MEKYDPFKTHYRFTNNKVIETKLKFVGLTDRNETICEEVKKEYFAKSIQEAESIIRLLKQGVTITQ